LQAQAANGRKAIAMNKSMRKFYSGLLLFALLFVQGIGIAAVNPSSLGGPKPQYVDLTGAPATGYQLFWYVGGSTSTKQNTYTDSTGLVANANPIVLNSLGEPASGIFFQAGLTYKAVLASPTDTDPPTSPIWTIDNIKGINDTTVTQSQWVAGPSPTFVSGTSFTLAGDQTSTFTAGLRLQIVDGIGTKYATVNTAAYNGTTLTTVTTINDGGLTLQNPLSAVSYGLLSATNISIPRFIQAGTSITVSYDTSGRPVINNSAPNVVLRNYIAGLTMSTAGSSGTMTIAAGTATDSTNAAYMTLAASIAKTTSSWAVGSAQGGLDTGAIANSTWYHFYEINRPDTNVTDVIFSLSASAPALPANYTIYRRIGSGKTDASAHWILFAQNGDEFTWDVPVNDVNVSNPGTSAVTRTVTVPTGITVFARCVFNEQNATSSAQNHLYTALSQTDTTPTSTLFDLRTNSAAQVSTTIQKSVLTNTSAQFRTRQDASGASDAFIITTLGWIDSRGKNQ